MKIRLLCRKETVEKVKAAIQKGDVQFDDHASMVLYEINHEYDYLLVKDGEEYMRLAVDEILYIESISQEILVHAKSGCYRSKNTMYQLEAKDSYQSLYEIHTGVG